MALPHAASGELIDVRPFGDAYAGARTAALFKTASMEVVRLVLPAGKNCRRTACPAKSRCNAWKGKSCSTSTARK